jgi:DNA repair exonuclease SbcCD nuclease subunit
MDVLIGNHDTYFKNTNSINSVQGLLSAYSKFNIYVEPTEINIGQRDILFLPWICDDNYDRSRKLIEETKAQVCMGHLELIGFEMHAGHINNDKGMSSTFFDKFFMTLTGHFHHKSSKNGIHYLGSPYPMTWNDWGDTRGFHIFDTISLDLTFIENPTSIFCKLFYDDSNETFESLVEKDYSGLAGMFIKIIVQNKTNPYWFDQFIESVQKVNPSDISIVDASFEENSGEEVLDEAKDTISILNDYVKGLKLQLHEKELLSLFNDLYTEAINTNDIT